MSNNLDDIQAIASLPDYITEANDIIAAYIDGKPTVEINTELAGQIMLAASCAEELINLYNELYDKQPELFPLDDQL